MYTSYRGMRSTGGADAPSGSTFRIWVLAATPSLKTLIELPIRIVADVRPPRPPLGEPRVESRRHEAVGALLALRGADRQVVGILVLGVARVAFDPPPGDLVRGDRAGERHLVVGRLGRVLVEVPARHAVAGRRLDQRGVATRARLGAVVAEAAFVGVNEDADRRRRRHLRAG